MQRWWALSLACFTLAPFSPTVMLCCCGNGQHPTPAGSVTFTSGCLTEGCLWMLGWTAADCRRRHEKLCYKCVNGLPAASSYGSPTGLAVAFLHICLLHCGSGKLLLHKHILSKLGLLRKYMSVRNRWTAVVVTPFLPLFFLGLINVWVKRLVGWLPITLTS